VFQNRTEYGDLNGKMTGAELVLQRQGVSPGIRAFGPTNHQSRQVVYRLHSHPSHVPQDLTAYHPRGLRLRTAGERDLNSRTGARP